MNLRFVFTRTLIGVYLALLGYGIIVTAQSGFYAAVWTSALADHVFMFGASIVSLCAILILALIHRFATRS